jgi:hypothetical protein
MKGTHHSLQRRADGLVFGKDAVVSLCKDALIGIHIVDTHFIHAELEWLNALVGIAGPNAIPVYFIEREKLGFCIPGMEIIDPECLVGKECVKTFLCLNPYGDQEKDDACYDSHGYSA